MARPSKPRDSSDEAMSNGSTSSEDEQINDQINEDDEEELEAVARSAGSDEDNSPVSDDEAVAEAEDGEEVILRFWTLLFSEDFGVPFFLVADLIFMFT